MARRAIFTDFDGTLAPVVADPETSLPLPGVDALLRELSSRSALVAVVSGRPVSFLVGALGYPGGPGPHPTLCGAYGLERWTVAEGVVTDERAEPFRQVLSRAAEEARDQTGGRVAVEHKGLGVTLHWRRNPPMATEASRIAGAIAVELGLELRKGKMSIELVPPVAVDKASAVNGLLDLVPSVERACFIGDDLGDLAAFRAIAGRGIEAERVAVLGAEVPEELLAEADLVLEGPEQVVDYLREMLRP